MTNRIKEAAQAVTRRSSTALVCAAIGAFALTGAFAAEAEAKEITVALSAAFTILTTRPTPSRRPLAAPSTKDS